jgi:hypothetical protein
MVIIHSDPAVVLSNSIAQDMGMAVTVLLVVERVLKGFA